MQMVYEQLEVAVYADGQLGFLMYEQFWDTVAPQVEVMKTQQTPNLEKGIILNEGFQKDFTYPPAQDPEPEPPFSVHSTLVKQVPFRKVLPLLKNCVQG